MWNLFKKKKTVQDVPLSQNKQPIAPGVKQNFAAVKAVLAENSDIIYRPFQSGAVDCGVIYVEGMIDQQLLEQDVIEPLTLSLIHIFYRCPCAFRGAQERLPCGSPGVCIPVIMRLYYYRKNAPISGAFRAFMG